jgi:putative two-component system response regulator
VVDVFDALTTSRLYKDPVDFDEAFDLVRRSSGTLFDPAVVQAFVNSRSEFLNLHNTRGE